jgi:hypothetical protein
MIKFSDYLDYLCLASAMEELTDDEVIVEFTELEWLKLSIAERAEIEAEESDLEEYKSRNTMQRRDTQRNKDRKKFSNRQDKLKAKIHRAKGGVKVKRLKVRKKWQKINKSKIANAHRVYGGKIKSKFTKTGSTHKRGGR